MAKGDIILARAHEKCNKFVDDYKKYKSVISDTKALRKRLYISLILLLFFCISDKSMSKFDFFIVSVEGLSADSAVIFLCAFVLCFAVIHLWKFFVACRDCGVGKFRKTVLKACFIPKFFYQDWFGQQQLEDLLTLESKIRIMVGNEPLEIIGDNMYGMLKGKIGSRLIVFFEMILIPWIIPWFSLVVAITVLYFKVPL